MSFSQGPSDGAAELAATSSLFANGAGLSPHITEYRRLQDKVAVVTGSSSGIGKAIALALAKAGAKLALVGRRPQGQFDEQVNARRSNTNWYCCDLAKEEQTKALSPRILDDFGGVDVLVHAAGVFAQGHLEDSPVVEFDRQYRVNLLAPYSLTKQLASSLRERHGQVVFINSSAARGARAGVSQYAATKAGLKAVADAFREELNPQGVRVLTVFVGRTATPMQEAIFKQEQREYVPERLLQPADVASVVLNCLSLPHTAEVTEIDIRPMLKT